MKFALLSLIHYAVRNDLVHHERIIRVKFAHSSGNFPEPLEIQMKRMCTFRSVRREDE